MATEKKGRASKVTKNDNNIDPDELWLRRRLPRYLPKRNNDVYVNNYSNFKGQEARALNLLHESGWVVVHGLGSAVPRAINLALCLQVAARAPAIIDTGLVNTRINVFEIFCVRYAFDDDIITDQIFLSPLAIIDDIEPSFDGGDQEYHAKGNAAVHIKVTLKENITKETVTPEKSKTST
ncbi:ribonuclease P protein subunit p20-like [Penaeus monodon]|uniref:ribonuclease P protein subunit p20-like n=1 Tax=Penaeus monodon TaxID=6687 RepID=UPI0018A717A2|nr:ribonuclease P protein subunit p20-like [Penaeus monodon]